MLSKLTVFKKTICIRSCSIILGLLVLLVFTPLTRAGHFVVGSENINYFPHYNFVSNQPDKGYAWAVLQAFAKAAGHSFEYQAFPIKRLQRELLENRIDFSYPDNPSWQSKKQDQTDKIFSQKFITSYGNTMVLATRKSTGLIDFDTVAVPHGFTSVMYAELVAKNRIQLLTVPDALSALKLVLMGRVDGADVEYNVANYLLRQQGQKGALIHDLSLPSDPVTFHLSTRKHPIIIKQLNQFLSSNNTLLKDLKATYQLIEPIRVRH
jgi:ABC-type amino acid transport substrate-binding protein